MSGKLKKKKKEEKQEGEIVNTDSCEMKRRSRECTMHSVGFDDGRAQRGVQFSRGVACTVAGRVPTGWINRRT